MRALWMVTSLRGMVDEKHLMFFGYLDADVSYDGSGKRTLQVISDLGPRTQQSRQSNLENLRMDGFGVF